MLFNGELVRFKSMKDALRIEIDIPTVDAMNVMKNITNFIDKPITVDININSEGVVHGFSKITDAQRLKIQALYSDLAKKYNIDKNDCIKRVKMKFLGAEESITGLSKMQASEYIDKLESMLITKEV